VRKPIRPDPKWKLKASEITTLVQAGASEEDELRKRLQAFADAHGLALSQVSDAVIKGLIKQRERWGEYYCPCRVVTGDPNADAWKICPCDAVFVDIERMGRCHCGLFTKSD